MRAGRIAGATLAVAGTLLFAWYVATSLPFEAVRPHLNARSGIALLLSAIVYGTTVPLSALAWQRLLASRMHVGFRRLAAILLTTQIGKYLPGNVGHLIGRTALALKQGLPATAVATTLVYEILLLLATGVVVGIAAAALSQPGLAQLRAHGATLAWVVVACVAGLAALPLGARALPKLIARIAPRHAAAAGDAAGLSLRPRDIALVIALYAGAYIAIGASAAVLAIGLAPAQWPDLALLTAAFAIAWVVGFVTPGAPAGIGVREALLVLMLGPSMGIAAATLLVLALRIATILGDILCFLAGMALMPHLRGHQPQPHPGPP